MPRRTPSAAAWSWVEHLRAGGSQAWADWRGASGDTPCGVRDDDPWLLPGAQQLELLRRLNLAGRPAPALAERVLAGSSWGRGAPDLTLVGAEPAGRTSGYGARPVDPAELPAVELVRMAAGLVAEDLAATPSPAPPRRARRRPLTRGFVLAGDPWLTGPAAAAYTAAGRPPIPAHDPVQRGRTRRAVVYVLATDVLTMSAHAFTARCLDAGAPTWVEWLGPAAQRRRLPPRADPLRIAGHWAMRIGRERVRIVLGAAGLGPWDDGWHELGRLVGVRRGVRPAPTASAAAVELARVVGAPLGVLVTPERRAWLLHDVLLPRLVAADPDGPPLGLPADGPGVGPGTATGHREAWRARGERERDALLAAGYPVSGDPGLLVPTDDVLAAGAPPDDARVLDLACRLLLAGPGPSETADARTEDR